MRLAQALLFDDWNHLVSLSPPMRAYNSVKFPTLIQAFSDSFQRIQKHTLL